jgi:hypothetical protein
MMRVPRSDEGGAAPTVESVTRFEDLPVGEAGSRRAVVRWSDGTEGEALRWYADLCGYPHKSDYAETAVMPRTRPARSGMGGAGRKDIRIIRCR